MLIDSGNSYVKFLGSVYTVCDLIAYVSLGYVVERNWLGLARALQWLMHGRRFRDPHEQTQQRTIYQRTTAFISRPYRILELEYGYVQWIWTPVLALYIQRQSVKTCPITEHALSALSLSRSIPLYLSISHTHTHTHTKRMSDQLNVESTYEK